jgi:signal transduction histidine kinase
MNPLNAVIANVSRLEDSPEELPEMKESLVRAVNASRRMGDFIGMIRKQLQQSEAENSFLANLEVQQAVDLLQYRAREIGYKLKFREKREVTVFGNPLKFHQVAINLISNAIDACEGVHRKQQVIMISLGIQGQHAVLRITDPGCGIAPDALAKIFDPFFTTKHEHRGIGLGLSTTKDIVSKSFGGTLSADSTYGRGSTFTVLIPLSKPAPLS